MTGPADYLRVGDWNVRCDRCGKKLKGSDAVLNWQGYYTCSSCWEPRQPQDFVRSIQEQPTPPFVRNPAPTYLSTPDPIISETDPPASALPWDYWYIVTEDGVLYFETES